MPAPRILLSKDKWTRCSSLRLTGWEVALMSNVLRQLRGGGDGVKLEELTTCPRVGKGIPQSRAFLSM